MARVPSRRPIRDNPRLLLAGIALLVVALVGLVTLARRTARLSPDFLTEVVLYALSIADLTMLVALVFSSSDSQPLTVALQQQVRQFGSNIEVLAPGAFISMVIPLAVFFAFQRQFVSGVMAGAVK